MAVVAARPLGVWLLPSSGGPLLAVMAEVAAPLQGVFVFPPSGGDLLAVMAVFAALPLGVEMIAWFCWLSRPWFHARPLDGCGSVYAGLRPRSKRRKLSLTAYTRLGW